MVINMVDVKTKEELEIEKLAITLRKNKLASSEGEARRMAEEMLTTGKKVSEDFAEREKKIFGEEKKDAEVELAHKQVEQLAANIGKGKADVRIDIPGIDVNKPLRELVKEEEELVEKEDDEVAVEIAQGPKEEIKEEVAEEPVKEEEAPVEEEVKEE
nr:hypothetical protein [Nanoarchaeota archaeon]